MATTTMDGDRAELIETVCRHAQDLGEHGAPGVDLDVLLHGYYRHVPLDDLRERSLEDLHGAAEHHLRTACTRPQGTATVEVFTPETAHDGWSAEGHSVVEVVTDDMPFLVDSVTMALTGAGHGVHLVVHPQLVVRRDVAGQLEAVLDEASRPDTSAHDVAAESWMHIEVDRVSEADRAELVARLSKVLLDVRDAVEDWSRMQQQAASVIEGLEQDPPPLAEEELDTGRELLRWLADDHFTFLGYREYHLREGAEGSVLVAVPGTGYGILRADPTGDPRVLPPSVAEHAREKTLLVLTKANSRSTVHRPVFLDYVGVKTFDTDGEVVGERRFLGLLTSSAYTESVTRIPVLREKVAAVLDHAGFEPMSHAGKALMDVLENYPRDELFSTPVEDLEPIAAQVMQSRERRQLRLFVRRDVYGRFLSCLVFLPRDRYNTTVRERLSDILREGLDGDSVEYAANVGESFAARLHFVVRPERGAVIPELSDADVAALEHRCQEAARSWRDELGRELISEHGDERGGPLTRTWGQAWPEAYKEDYSPRTAALDLTRLEALGETGEQISLALYEPGEQDPDDPHAPNARLKVYRVGPALSLSQVLPIVSTMGVEVVDERPYELDLADREVRLYDFGLRAPEALTPQARDLFTDAVMAVWRGFNEADGFNALVLAAGLSWRQVTVLRAYAKYMRQGGTPFAQDYIEEALRGNVEITRALVELFETRFDPAYDGDREAAEQKVEERIASALDAVTSLDQDRILRSYLVAVQASLRTSYYQRDEQGEPRARLSIKLDPSAIPELPEPRPKFEIFVYSPRVEGVHLRFGDVARGGLRWSDRRDDFRTEVLGLVKAQMVKNTVIVPVGAKGGFFPKQLPDMAEDREAWLTEGKACYRTFICGLLDLTDNLLDNEAVPPADTVRHDGDDPYLVVAADKGTATFSDLANSIAAEYDFWLGDAFASGGSVGYDHKAMGITARGAWVSVRRHFREMGVDCQTQDITCAGIGDMSGDVFGNGMLCSEHIRLVAAFDHRHVFLDPDPDAATSYAERRRLFDLPRSSWADYDTALISEGGGVYPRTLKSIPLSAPVREALGVEATSLTPAQLINAILHAPVDLLWNGGIGTYVKASTESHADAGDKANDPIRVDGGELRARCVGEGGNLGLTQRGRIEYAAAGGRIVTDFIDNSAGVDTSDHEVNIKILLDAAVKAGELGGEERNTLLASMTDQVAHQVLGDNYDQNLALANAESLAPALAHVHEEWMRTLEGAGQLNRELEALPSRREMAARRERREGLTAPELAVLMSYTKIVLAENLLESGLADDTFFRSLLYSYFPQKMRQDYRPQMEAHPLRSQVVVTQVVNQMVNAAGITFLPRLSGETGADAEELARAHFVAREVYGAQSLQRAVAELDNQVDAAVQTRMRLEVRTLVERASRWLVNHRRSPIDCEEVVDHFEVVVERVMGALPDLMTGRELTAFRERRDSLVSEGVPEELAQRVAVCPPAYVLLDVIENAERLETDPMEVARVHYALGERLGLPLVVDRILALPRRDRWETMARAALRDDLHSVHADLTARVLEGSDPEESATSRVATWEESDEVAVSRAATTLEEICSEEDSDLARMSVGLRTVRSLTSSR